MTYVFQITTAKPNCSQTEQYRKRSARYLKQLFAAYHFLYTSRDGAEPIYLYRWSESPRWINAIRYWQPDFEGDTQLQGKYFKTVVGDSIVQRSLKTALLDRAC